MFPHPGAFSHHMLQPEFSEKAFCFGDSLTLKQNTFIHFWETYLVSFLSGMTAGQSHNVCCIIQLLERVNVAGGGI